MLARADVRMWKHILNPRKRLQEVSVAIVLRERESRLHGEGPHRERLRVANTLNAKAWESSPMSAEHESWKSSHGVAVCGESRTPGGNGGDGKTQFGCAFCPYPLGKPPRCRAWLRKHMVSQRSGERPTG